MNEARPCQFRSCRYHLSGTKIGNDDVTETCVLDVADRGPQNLDEIGAIFGVTRERVRQIEAKALERLEGALRRRGLSLEGLLPSEGAPSIEDSAPASDYGHTLTADEVNRGMRRAGVPVGKMVYMRPRGRPKGPGKDVYVPETDGLLESGGGMSLSLVGKASGVVPAGPSSPVVATPPSPCRPGGPEETGISAEETNPRKQPEALVTVPMKPDAPMTERQQKVWDAYQAFVRDAGREPTNIELAGRAGVTGSSKEAAASNVSAALNDLRARGMPIPKKKPGRVPSAKLAPAPPVRVTFDLEPIEEAAKLPPVAAPAPADSAMVLVARPEVPKGRVALVNGLDVSIMEIDAKIGRLREERAALVKAREILAS